MKALNIDADLYVTVMDGRNPTSIDFDYMSEMFGADQVRVSSTDALFDPSSKTHEWDASVGVIFVIGVLSQSENRVDYSLTVEGPTIHKHNMTDLVSNMPMVYDLPAVSTRSNQSTEVYIYRWSNWLSLDFTL